MHIYVWDVENEAQVLDCIEKEVDAIIANDPMMVRNVYNKR